MPVENSGLIFPKADVQFEAPEGPQEVTFDDGTGHAGEGDAVETPVTVDHSELHQPSSTDQFPASEEPISVVQPGYEDAAPAEQVAEQQPGASEAAAASGDDAAGENAALQKATDDVTAAVAELQAAEQPEAPAPADGKTVAGAQAKVVQQPASQPAAGTDGAQTK